MICETCHGAHFIGVLIKSESGDSAIVAPCPDCIGGISNCCEGERPDCATLYGMPVISVSTNKAQ